MLRISKLTDYAVVLTTHLTRCDTPHSVRDLAAETQVPQATVSKVLKQLARAGVVTSTRGKSGGYMLARPAKDIPVVDVITALEGPIAVTECSDDTIDSGCDLESNCGTRANWQRINQAVHAALSDVSVADMAEGAGLALVPLGRPRRDSAAESTASPEVTVER